MKSNKLRIQQHYPIYTLKIQKKVFIQIILIELRILESQNKSLKTTLGVYDFEAKKRPQSGIEKLANSQTKKIELGQKPSDYAKYPTNQKLSNLFVDECAFGSSAVRIEYIRELEFLVDALKKQNAELQTQIQTKKPNLQHSSIIVPKKYEGYDCLNDQILVQKSTIINVSKITTDNELTSKNKLKPDNSLKDRQTLCQILQINSKFNRGKETFTVHFKQNFYLFNYLQKFFKFIKFFKAIIEQEVSMYKETLKTRQSKREGFDADKMVKKFDKNSIIYGAKQKFLIQGNHDEEIKEKYLQALMQETFLLQQQLQKIQEESKYFDPHKKSEL